LEKIRKKYLSTFLATRRFKIRNLGSFILGIQKYRDRKGVVGIPQCEKDILFKELNNCNATIIIMRVLCHVFIIIK